jgi:hypothetical protein
LCESEREREEKWEEGLAETIIRREILCELDEGGLTWDLPFL